MSGPLRSKQGCWTCRLRKKKCDEGRPRCSTCQSLAITCYGYGSKPDWMDGGEEERAVAKSLKEIVKRTARRKPTTLVPASGTPITRLAPKSSDGLVGNSALGLVERLGDTPSSPSNNEPPQKDEDLGMPQDIRSANSSSSEGASYLKPGSMISQSPDELALVMHFLDQVFPLQFPLYNPGVLDGGRDWLLPLLLLSKPFYDAALAISAYHRRTVMFVKLSRPHRVTSVVQQEQHLQSCIRALSKEAQNTCPKKTLGIVAAVVQLVFFELFTGHSNAWQAHLGAVLEMYRQGYREAFSNFGLAEETRNIVIEGHPLSEDEEVPTSEIAALRFLSGTVLWLDIISSVTAGVGPRLFDYHSRALTTDSQIQLETVMGCENRVMLQIGRIAALHTHKTQALQRGDFDDKAFEQAVSDINKAIQDGLDPGAWKRDSTLGLDAITRPSKLVTHVFGYMAAIYLHLVTHGFQRLETLGIAISRATRLFQTKIATTVLPTLVLPLFIVGSVVQKGDEPFFRNVFSSLQLLDPSLKHRERISPILEEIWSRRQSSPGFAWNDSLGLTGDILLI